MFYIYDQKFHKINARNVTHINLFKIANKANLTDGIIII
jgi:hypothetical protein